MNYQVALEAIAYLLQLAFFAGGAIALVRQMRKEQEEQKIRVEKEKNELKAQINGVGKCMRDGQGSELEHFRRLCGVLQLLAPEGKRLEVTKLLSEK